jgi:acyl carrier protein
MTHATQSLVRELKERIVSTLNLVDVSPEDIDDREQLVGGRLGVDSIDVLELVIMLERDYSVKIEDREVGSRVFADLQSLADYVAANQPESQH